MCREGAGADGRRRRSPTHVTSPLTNGPAPPPSRTTTRGAALPSHPLHGPPTPCHGRSSFKCRNGPATRLERCDNSQDQQDEEGERRTTTWHGTQTASADVDSPRCAITFTLAPPTIEHLCVDAGVPSSGWEQGFRDPAQDRAALHRKCAEELCISLRRRPLLALIGCGRHAGNRGQLDSDLGEGRSEGPLGNPAQGTTRSFVPKWALRARVQRKASAPPAPMFAMKQTFKVSDRSIRGPRNRFFHGHRRRCADVRPKPSFELASQDEAPSGLCSGLRAPPVRPPESTPETTSRSWPRAPRSVQLLNTCGR